MIYQRDLQILLQERYRRLFKAHYNVYDREVKYLRDFIKKQPALSSIAGVIERSERELDPSKWIDEHFGWNQFNWPETELGRAKVAWHIVNGWADNGGALSLACDITGEGRFQDALRGATEHIVEPLVEYLSEQLGMASDVLYLLERYARLVRWFDQEALYESYHSDTRRGEATYEQHLRRFLFEQGVNYPFSQTESPSGKADVISGLEADDPLVCEVKLFDGDSYGRPYLAKGVNQALQYAADWGKTVGHLVIFNLTERPLELPTDGEGSQWPPRLELGSATVFLVAVQALPLESASKQKKSNPWKITRDDLVSTVE